MSDVKLSNTSVTHSIKTCKKNDTTGHYRNVYKNIIILYLITAREKKKILYLLYISGRL